MAEENRARFQERLEFVQLRLEGGISAAELPNSGAPGWLAGVAVVGVLLAVGSLAPGLFSIWGG